MRTPRFDLAVVGASFAGLACAEAAARRGLRVVVLERKRDAGSGVHTTGLLTREGLAALRPPPSVLGARLDAIELCAKAAGHAPAARIAREGAGFVATDTAELLRVLASRAADAGAEMRFGASVESVEQHALGVTLRGGRTAVLAARVAGCDGARSRVARDAGLPAPRRVLSGAERHVELAPGHGLDPGACLLLLDDALAPGYAAWCVKGVGGAWQVGVLGLPRRGWRPDAALDGVMRWLHDARGARVTAVLETRGGVVPAGGALARPWSGRVVLAGDAAGHVSALTAGGIGRAALAGRAVGEGIGEHGEPWRAALQAMARECGGWRLAAARGLQLAVRATAPAAVALARLSVPRDLAATLAFRASGYGRGEEARASRVSIGR